MAAVMHIQPQDLWKFFLQNLCKMEEESCEIAVNDETGYAIYLTKDEDDNALFLVFKDDAEEPEEVEYALNDDDCKHTFQKLFEQYLVPVTVVSGGLPEPELKEAVKTVSRDDELDEIEIRDNELLEAVNDLMYTFLGSTELIDDDMEYDFVDLICTHLAQGYGLSVYRPCHVGEGENTVYTEFPYDDLTGITDEESDIPNDMPPPPEE